jgi:Sulfotransferase family
MTGLRAVGDRLAGQGDEAVVARIRAALAAGQYQEARATLERVGRDLLPDPRRRIEEATPPALRRVVFICGLHRSGTSVLEHHLSARYQAARLRARVPENEGQFLQDVFPLEQPYGGPGHFAFYPQMTLNAVVDPQTAQAMRARLLRTWAPWIEGDAGVLIEKSPPNLTRIGYLRSLFPEARFVVWTRDPRAVAVSTRKWTAVPLPVLMQHWNTAYMKAIEALEEDCVLASYEGFCADPESSLRRIADFCSLESRADTLPLAPRFAQISDGNAKYLLNFPPYRNRAKIKAWDLLGYSL